jgi:hypothetical protein
VRKDEKSGLSWSTVQIIGAFHQRKEDCDVIYSSRAMEDLRSVFYDVSRKLLLSNPYAQPPTHLDLSKSKFSTILTLNLNNTKQHPSTY